MFLYPLSVKKDVISGWRKAISLCSPENRINMDVEVMAYDCRLFSMKLDFQQYLRSLQMSC